MEGIKPKTGKYALNYGILLGAIYLVFNLMLFFMDMHYSRETSITVVTVLLMVGVIGWAIFNFRKQNEGLLSISEALKIGAGTALIAAIISIIYTAVLSNFLDPEFATKVAEIQRNVDQAGGYMTDDQIQQRYDGTVNYFWMSYPFIVLLYVVFGLVVGLIGGLVLQKKKSTF